MIEIEHLIASDFGKQLGHMSVERYAAILRMQKNAAATLDLTSHRVINWIWRKFRSVKSIRGNGLNLVGGDCW